MDKGYCFELSWAVEKGRYYFMNFIGNISCHKQCLSWGKERGNNNYCNRYASNCMQYWRVLHFDWPNQSSLGRMEICLAIGMHQSACNLGEVFVLTDQTSLLGSNGNLHVACNLGDISILTDQTSLLEVQWKFVCNTYISNCMQSWIDLCFDWPNHSFRCNQKLFCNRHASNCMQ